MIAIAILFAGFECEHNREKTNGRRTVKMQILMNMFNKYFELCYYESGAFIYPVPTVATPESFKNQLVETPILHSTVLKSYEHFRNTSTG